MSIGSNTKTVYVMGWTGSFEKLSGTFCSIIVLCSTVLWSVKVYSVHFGTKMNWFWFIFVSNLHLRFKIIFSVTERKLAKGKLHVCGYFVW